MKVSGAVFETLSTNNIAELNPFPRVAFLKNLAAFIHMQEGA